MNLFLIDALAPFFTEPVHERTNWSKVPFARFAPGGIPDTALCERIEAQFEHFCRAVSRLGFNAVMLDDLCHVVLLDCHTASLRAGIRLMQSWYRRLIGIARGCGLATYLNTDVMFFTTELDALIGGRQRRAVSVLRDACKQALDELAIDGVILRLGESDGLDTNDIFYSRLFVKTPLQARRFIRGLIPLFEERNKTLIVRTWTVGAYPIGDLMWNARTWRTVFSRLPTANLLVSMKPGDTDFFRQVDVNPLFFERGPRKILELQARREYEGFGVFPSFCGFECERYRQRLRWDSDLAGISVWSQTGGWNRFGALTFVNASSSAWNEINTAVSLWVFKDGMSSGRAVERFTHLMSKPVDCKKLLRLLTLSDMLMRELWYLPAFARKRLYFRRVRVPPLLWVFWDTLVINHALRRLLRWQIPRQYRAAAIRDGYRALESFVEMKELAASLGFDAASFELMEDTFRMIALAREYFLGEWWLFTADRIRTAAREYRSKHPDGFDIETDFSPFHSGTRPAKIALALALRRRPAYRLLDSIVIVRLARFIYPILSMWQKKKLPEFTRTTAMGIETLLK